MMMRREWVCLLAVTVVAACSKEEPPGQDESSEGTGIDVETEGETQGAASGPSSASDGDEKLDVGDGQDGAGPGDCNDSGGGAEAFSIIWIANSPEGTVSKIDTGTGQELARYFTGPAEGSDDPSRTSVNLEGDVAVTNRFGGIAKFAAEASRCVDANGNGTIETSTGPTDVMPYGEDECLLWHADLPGDGDARHGPRPTAWDAGGAGNPCQTADDRVWVGWWDYASNEGRFRRILGADGATDVEIAVPDWDPDQSTHYGPYGGAVDGDGKFWVVGRSPGPLVMIDGETMDYTRFEVPEETHPYGIALDANGHPWLAGTDGYVSHFDPETEQFDVIDVEVTPRMRGLQVDREGFAWIASNDPCGAVKIDTTTLAVVGGLVDLPDCDDPVGVSIDSEGYVWLPDRGADRAYKVHPHTLAVTQTDGLVAPYTYSDMTGAGLGLVTNPPQG